MNQFSTRPSHDTGPAAVCLVLRWAYAAIHYSRMNAGLRSYVCSICVYIVEVVHGARTLGIANVTSQPQRYGSEAYHFPQAPSLSCPYVFDAAAAAAIRHPRTTGTFH